MKKYAALTITLLLTSLSSAASWEDPIVCACEYVSSPSDSLEFLLCWKEGMYKVEEKGHSVTDVVHMICSKNSTVDKNECLEFSKKSRSACQKR